MPEADNEFTIDAVVKAWRSVPIEFLGIDSQLGADASEATNTSHRDSTSKILFSLRSTTTASDWLHKLLAKNKTRKILMNNFVYGLVRWAMRLQKGSSSQEEIANQVILNSHYWKLYHGVYVELAERSINGADKYMKTRMLEKCKTVFDDATMEQIHLEGVLESEPSLEATTQDLIQGIIQVALESGYSQRPRKSKTFDGTARSNERTQMLEGYDNQSSRKSKRKQRASANQEADNDEKDESSKRSKAASKGGHTKKHESVKVSLGNPMDSAHISHRKDGEISISISSQWKGKRKIPPGLDDDASSNNTAVVLPRLKHEKKADKKSKKTQSAAGPVHEATSLGQDDTNYPDNALKPLVRGNKRLRITCADSDATIGVEDNSISRKGTGSREVKIKRNRKSSPAKSKWTPDQQQLVPYIGDSTTPSALIRTPSGGSDILSEASSSTLVGIEAHLEKTNKEGTVQDVIRAEKVLEHDLPIPISTLSITRPQSGRVICLDNQEGWRSARASLQAMSSSSSVRVKRQLPDGVRPHLWASSRQAVCETTSFFRSYHGGVYQRQGEMEGYLLGGFSSERDQCAHDGRLIISHGGGSGGRTLNETSGQDEDDKTVRALKNAFKQKKPIVLLADDQYALFPYQFAPQWVYVVLGFYTIVDAWEERDVDEIDGLLCGRTKYKFAFQYCDRKDPWWAPATSNDSQLPPEPFKIDSNKCSECEKESPMVYEQRWLCLNSKCRQFFDVKAEEYPSLKMSSNFLALRNIEKRLCRYRYQFEDKEGAAKLRYTARGLRCTTCGQLCPREHWEKWWCSSCEQPIPMADNSKLPIVGPRDYSFSHSQLSNVPYKSSITMKRTHWYLPGEKTRACGLHYMFILPEKRGTIHLIQSESFFCKQANALFTAYQEEARDRPFLRRYPLQSHQARGQFLSNYFSHNAGVPYKYIVSTNATVPFDQAPQCVNDALGLIKERASHVLEKTVDFNEILTAAYMERQSMSYHTDDEKGLGPTVASLSLGSPALMHFRPRKRAFKEQREKAAAQAHADTQLGEARVESRHQNRVNADRHLTILLRHGDILVMDGAKIQELYEHTVEPCNFRIAATARMIRADSV